MYQQNSFNGADLPAKTLCLTFDDGPGIHTLAIARFLFENHIRATFFVVGKYAFHQPEILKELKEMGHLIGNHTYDHPDLPYYVSVNGDVINQVLRTDAIIKPFVDSGQIYFRAPYGKWSAEVAQELNRSMLTANHIGPIHWEIAGVDCYYWQNNWAVEDAAARYLSDIELNNQRGIVVFHDEIADMDVVKPHNKTLDLLKILIPQLLEQGYQFVRLDEIIPIKTASAEKPKFTLRIGKEKCVSLKNDTDLNCEGKPENPQNLLCLEELGFGKIAIKAANNLYLSSAEIEIKANRAVIGETETFDLIPVDKNKIMLRCYDGNYVGIEKGKLTKKAPHMRQAAIFSYANHNHMITDDIAWEQRLLLLKKQLLFVRSKLQQKI
ncbi:polysaccharide deacetylase family protein [uncultured Mucilaginibacter sp.]|uniref:polysaccharide deacetylase family protein n=1 Tax=uncultured Mucilaginibacter sp. TaxID=797541 RepID=UPI00260F2147|nr:polysaccharide deacetylase family protein [uncultured Mucilaginibacter sp.]